MPTANLPSFKKCLDKFTLDTSLGAQQIQRLWAQAGQVAGGVCPGSTQQQDRNLCSALTPCWVESGQQWAGQILGLSWDSSVNTSRSD